MDAVPMVFLCYADHPPPGGKHHHKKQVLLKPRQVLEIRAMLASGLSHSRVAHRYGVGASTIGRISRGQTWDWLRTKEDLVKKPPPKTRAILKPEQVQDIRARLKRGETQQAVAKHYHIHPSVVWQIKEGRIWKWLKEEE